MEHLKLSPIIAEEQIKKRIKEIAKDITKSSSGKTLVAVGVLKGSFLFYADLIREIGLDMICDFCGASSYGDDSKSSGEVHLTLDLQTSMLDTLT